MKKVPGKVVALAFILGYAAFFAFRSVRGRPVTVMVSAVESDMNPPASFREYEPRIECFGS